MEKGYPKKIAADFPEAGSKVDAALHHNGEQNMVFLNIYVLMNLLSLGLQYMVPKNQRLLIIAFK